LCACGGIAAVIGWKGFDLIVSLETIEHLQEPERFWRTCARRSIRAVVSLSVVPMTGGIFIGAGKNPYHVRKYHFEEFRAQTEAILGAASVWLNGAPTFGFLNSVRGACIGASSESSQLEMLKGQNIGLTRVLPARNERRSH
jgi:hypothetical protein